MRKCFGLFLTLMLLITCFGSLLAETSDSVEKAMPSEPVKQTSGDFEFLVLEDGTLEITKYSGETEKLVIPEELDGIKLTSIGDDAFNNNATLTSVTIPNSVSKIGANPFGRCEKLTRIDVPPDHPLLATIDGVLFSKQDKRLICYPFAFTADSYEIPKGIKIIGDAAFISCSSLTSITIPESVTSIGKSAFFACSSLPFIIIPDSVTRIGDWAFSSCRSLSSITIPESVTSIGNYVFSRCNSLTSITIPESVTSIGDGAFCDSRSLTTITIPESVTSIGGVAFSGCPSLLSIKIPDGVISIEYGTFSSCSALESIVIPDSVTSIGENAFYNCSSLTSITIPEGVTSIGDNAFAGCSSLMVTVARGTFAEQYCKDNELSYTYPDALDWLNE